PLSLHHPYDDVEERVHSAADIPGPQFCLVAVPDVCDRRDPACQFGVVATVSAEPCRLYGDRYWPLDGAAWFRDHVCNDVRRPHGAAHRPAIPDDHGHGLDALVDVG